MLALALVSTFNFSACKTCKGGGWYGDRNLGYTPEPVYEETPETTAVIMEEEWCD